LWEPENEEDDGRLRSIGDSFEDVLDPARFEKTRVCAHCGSELIGSPCTVCGERRGETPAREPDRDVAETMVHALVASGDLVTRSARSIARIIYAITEILHAVDDDKSAALEIISTWEDAPEVGEVFVGPDDLSARFLPDRWTSQRKKAAVD